MRLGVTGTVMGASSAQLAKAAEFMRSWDYAELHHGSAVGFDAQAHDIGLALRDSPDHVLGHPWITVHPPLATAKKAACNGADEYRKPYEFLERDRHIVDESDVLLAAPLSDEEVLRSGTWATMRYARKCRILVVQVCRDGSVRFQ